MRNNPRLVYRNNMYAQTQAQNSIANASSNQIVDFGPNPMSLDISKMSESNDYYRRAIWTGKNLQVTLMSIKKGDDIGLEVHPNNDQFLRIEKGSGQVQMGNAKDNLTYIQPIFEDSAVFVPAGTWHNIINTGDEDMKLYTIYAPPHHPRGVVHVTKEQAEIEGD